MHLTEGLRPHTRGDRWQESPWWPRCRPERSERSWTNTHSVRERDRESERANRCGYSTDLIIVSTYFAQNLVLLNFRKHHFSQMVHNSRNKVMKCHFRGIRDFGESVGRLGGGEDRPAPELKSVSTFLLPEVKGQLTPPPAAYTWCRGKKKNK